jgi:hypothetical protein
MRVAFVLVALLLASAPPVRAQAVQPVDSEPAVPRGAVAVRVLNATGCPMGVRVTMNGIRRGTIAVPGNDWRSLHLRPDTAVAIEVEVLASPRFCPTVAPDGTHTPTVQRARVALVTDDWLRR